MAHDIKPAARQLLVLSNARFATLWTVERADGVVLRFTDHDRPLVKDGQTFSPGAGVAPTARQRTEGLEPQNIEVRGALDSAAITEEDLRAGRYRAAKVTEQLVDWEYPWAGEFSSSTYYVEDTTFDGEQWNAKLVGLKRLLNRTVGDVYSRGCRWRLLGDADCTVNLTPLTQSSTVGVVVTSRRRFTSGATAADGYFELGSLTFTSGLNSGLSFEVGTSLATGEIELLLPTPFDIVAGDGFSVSPGCDRTIGTCKDKFNNLANFGGFPDIVGTDAAYATPNVKV